MASALLESPTSELQVELTCPVCLELYQEPHQLPCGHNFCLRCINHLIRPQHAIFHCPECRVVCNSKDPLQKNYKLSNITDHYYNRHRGHKATSSLRRTSPLAKTSVQCDYCFPAASQALRPRPASGTSASWDGNPQSSGTVTRPVKPAVKLCLKCEVKMCQEHLIPHLELPVFRDHPLTDVTEYTDFKKMKCQDHDEIYSYYCMDEKLFVCNACIVEGGHKEHSIKTLRNASKDLKGALDLQLNLAESQSTITEFKLLTEEERDRCIKNFVKVSKNHMRKLRALMHDKVDGFVDRLLGMMHDHSKHIALCIQENIKKIKEDQDRLEQISADIQGIMSDNHFLFIDAYKKKEQQLRNYLQQCLFNPKGIEWSAGDLRVQMEGEMSAFTSFLDVIQAELVALCHIPEEEMVEEEEYVDELSLGSTLEVIEEEDEVGEEEEEVSDETEGFEMGDEGTREEEAFEETAEEEDVGEEEYEEELEDDMGEEEYEEVEDDMGEEEVEEDEEYEEMSDEEDEV